MKIYRWVAGFLGLLVCIATVLPFIRTDQWWIRIFDFPRLQILFLGAVAAGLFSLTFRRLAPLEKLLAGLLVVALAVQTAQVFPYTPLASKEVKDASSENKPDIKVFVANVLMENRNARALLEQIEAANPDLILLTEPNDWWTAQMKPLEKLYPQTVLQPQTNTYGMNLYSRFELIDSEVRFVVDNEVPSICAKVKIPGGATVLFYGVHPRPPGENAPEEADRTDSTQRDVELVLIGREVRQSGNIPAIVAGDFNDVAWSHTTRLFQRLSGLLDPRIGRGFFNSYNAKLWFLRFPLDHLFHSEHFKLVEMQRMNSFGSDHFPIMATLSLQPEATAEQERPQPKASDPEEAQKILERPRQD